MIINKAEVLSFPQVLRILKICDKPDVSENELKELRSSYVDQVLTLLEDYDDYVQNEMYGNQPVAILRTLGDYHLHISAYIGVGEAISKTLKTTVYRRLTAPDEKGDNKAKKLTQVDKENFSRAEIASLEGVIETLNRVSYNVHERSEGVKEKRKPYIR